MHQTKAIVGEVSRDVKFEKSSRHGCGGEFGSESKMIEQAGDGLQRPLEQPRQDHNPRGFPVISATSLASPA